MKIILTTSLFFCLTITTILAQVVTTNISAPNSSGLSSNSVGDFDVNSDGTILNNSATSGTATLGGTAVTGNSNIPAGGEASLILFQVTGSGGSDLDGTIEVFGGEAGLIIANPNGIVCDGCAFTNVNRVDLVTGSGYDAGTNTFSTIAATDITVEGSALELSNVDLNIQTGRDFSNDVAINVDTFNITAGADFKNAGAIVSETVTIDVTSFDNDIANTGTVSATSLNFILTADLNSFATTFNGFNSFRNLAITTEGAFSNFTVLDLDNLTINSGSIFENHSIITAASFTATSGLNFNNRATIDTDSLTVTAQYFHNRGATINTNSFTATIEETFNNNQSAVITAGSFTVTAKNFSHIDDSTIDAATVTIEAANFASNIDNAEGNVSSDSLNFILTDDFTHASDSFTGFTFNNLAITTEGTFTNNATINPTGNLTITANSFANSGDISANIFNAIVDSFSNEADATITAAECNLVHTSYTNNGTIACLNFEGDAVVFEIAEPTDGLSDNSYTDFNISVNGVVFNNSDSAGTSQLAGDISANPNISIGEAASIILAQVTGTTPSLLVGALEVFGAEAVVIIANPNGISCNACSFINASRVDLVTGNYDAGTNTFGTIDENTNIAIIENGLDASSVGILNIQAGSFTNTGGLKANIFNLNVVGDFDYTQRGIINATIFDLEVGGDFSHNDAANNFVWAANDTLTVSGNVNIVAADFANSGAITVTNSGNFTANTFSNTGTVSAATVTIGVTNFVDDITNTGTVSSASLNFILTDDFTHISDSFSAFNNFSNLAITTNGVFTNNNNIDLAGDLTITANSFANTGGVVADALTVSVAGDFDYGSITANSYNLNVDGDFSYDDAANDFVLGLNDTLTVLGSANIVAADFANSGTIAVTGSLGITAAGFDNSSIIRASSIFNVTVGDFINRAGATITAAECNFVHDSFTDEGTITCLNSNTVDTTVDNIAEPNSSGLSVNNYEAFHIPVNGRVFNNSVSGATSQLLGDVPANPNFISGNAANIILAQVSGTEISLLLGAFEVVGAAAEVIIANPNGISCNGCSVINASQLDLRTDNSIAIADNGLDASDVDILNIRAGSFTNTGVLEANILNLNVNGDFDYTQRGIINNTSLTLEVGGDFSNNDATTGFVWEETDTLTVSGNANITALNFINHGAINVADSGSSGSFEITTGYTAINQGSIVSDILAINAADFFRNLDGDIDVASLNITAGGKVTNTANINVTGTLTITANDDSTRTDDRTGFYVSNRGNITATTLNITAVDNFYNRGNITATNFTASAKSVFLLNREINSFDGIYDGGNISLARNSSLIAAGIIENYGNIDLGVFNLDISADSFTNHASATITANTVNLAVTSYINDGTIDAVVVNDGGIIDTTNDQ